jgi:hypothetical protein
MGGSLTQPTPWETEQEGLRVVNHSWREGTTPSPSTPGVVSAGWPRRAPQRSLRSERGQYKERAARPPAIYLTPGEMMLPPEKYAPTNFVPAVAVRRRGQVLSVMTGRKGRVGGRTGDRSRPPPRRGNSRPGGSSGTSAHLVAPAKSSPEGSRS